MELAMSMLQGMLQSNRQPSDAADGRYCKIIGDVSPHGVQWALWLTSRTIRALAVCGSFTRVVVLDLGPTGNNTTRH